MFNKVNIKKDNILHKKLFKNNMNRKSSETEGTFSSVQEGVELAFFCKRTVINDYYRRGGAEAPKTRKRIIFINK